MSDGSHAEIQALRVQLERFRRIVDVAPSMLAYWDADQVCRFANRAYERSFHAVPDSLIGSTLRELLGSTYLLNLPSIEAVLGGEPQEFERTIADLDGGPPRCAQVHYEPDVVDGVVRGFVSVAFDVSARKALEGQLRDAQAQADLRATHDALTGLPNRLLLSDRLNQAIENARRYKRGCAVMFLDLDGFKRVNDGFGHDAGDQLLCEVARRLVAVLRKVDTTARLGGDEFVLLLPEVLTPEQAGIVAQKVLDAVGGAPIAIAAQSIHVTLSIGVSIVPVDGLEAREILAKADQALYEAKRRGKNRFAVFSEG